MLLQATGPELVALMSSRMPQYSYTNGMVKADRPHTHHIDINKVRTTKAVIVALDKLNTSLPSTKLLRVVFFNRAYAIVTKKINDATQSGLFVHPKEMASLEIAFAIRYFEALNHYADDGVLPGAWQRINTGWLHGKHPASFSLLLGANAHINHDLLISLKKTITKPTEFRDDYFKVNKLLLDSGKEISRSYYESDPTVNFMKKALRPIYLKPTMWLILRWRTRVWKELAK